MNTSRAAARIRSSLRAASARRPLCAVLSIGSILTERIIPFCYSCGTERFVPKWTNNPKGVLVDWKLELVQVPVSDVDRAKAFYVDQLGFNADHDHQVN